MIEQNSPEWFKSRLGYFTGSKIGALMSSSKKKDELFGKTAMDYIYEVASERELLPAYLEDDYLFEIYQNQVSFSNKYTQFGHENESFAIEEFEKIIGKETTAIDSVKHPSILFFSASPDRLINSEEGCEVVEVKCPTPKVFMKYKNEIKDNHTLKSVNPDYYYQIMSEISVTNAKSAYFVCFCPFLKKSLHYCKIVPDEDAINEITYRVNEANKVVNSIINKK